MGWRRECVFLRDDRERKSAASFASRARVFHPRELAVGILLGVALCNYTIMAGLCCKLFFALN